MVARGSRIEGTPGVELKWKAVEQRGGYRAAAFTGLTSCLVLAFFS